MAVQAQHSSNLWLSDLISRNSQEKKESLGPPINSDDALHAPEQKLIVGSLPQSNSPMAFLPQSQQQQQQYHQNQHQEKPYLMINLEDLRLPNASSSSAISPVFTGLRLSLKDQQNQITIVSSEEDDLSRILYQHQQEIDHLTRSQGDQLRRTLIGKTQTHCQTLVAAVERTVERKLREKESECERVSRRTADLQQRLEQLRRESIFWQTKAHEQEAVAATLQARLESATQAIRSGVEPKDAESSTTNRQPTVSSAPGMCRVCREKTASVVVLPCRHLCVCSHCTAVLTSCPLCGGARTAFIESNLF